MSKVIAKGKYMGVEKQVEVILEDDLPIIELDGEYDELVQNKFNELLKETPALGGTYYPPENSLLAAYSVLESIFFDLGSRPEMMVEGDIGTIPCEPDIVY